MPEWKAVRGHEGIYEVSDEGLLRNLETGRTLDPKPAKNGGRRELILRRHDGTVARTRAYVVVLEAFVGPRPDGAHAAHRNDVPWDDRLENLYWASPSENAYDKIRNGHDVNASKTHCKSGHEFSGDNLRMRQWKNGRISRECVTCDKEQHAANYLKRKAAKEV